MQWLVKDKQSCEAFCEAVRAMYEKNKYVIFKYELSKRRSLPQNSLFQKWSRELAAHEMGCRPNEVSDADHTRTKISLKRAYYSYSADDEMIIVDLDVFTGKESPPRAQSTANLSPGSMFNFMEFTQNLAAERGCMLESIGQYKELKTYAP